MFIRHFCFSQNLIHFNSLIKVWAHQTLWAGLLSIFHRNCEKCVSIKKKQKTKKSAVRVKIEKSDVSHFRFGLIVCTSAQSPKTAVGMNQFLDADININAVGLKKVEWREKSERKMATVKATDKQPQSYHKIWIDDSLCLILLECWHRQYA